jgi:hypothetical protein
MSILKMTLVVVFCLGVALNLLLMINLYEFIPQYSVDNTIPLLNTNGEILLSSYFENAENVSYHFEENKLTLSLIPGNETEDYSLYTINIKFNLPLQPSLNISFTICGNLSVESDGGFIILYLSNEDQMIEASYYIGQNPLEYRMVGHYYIDYQIGNLSNTWFKCTRNIETDLSTKNLAEKGPWKIIEVKVGIISYPLKEIANRELEVSLNLADSFFKSDASYVNIRMTSILFSFRFLALVVAVTFVLYLIYVTIRKKL